MCLQHTIIRLQQVVILSFVFILKKVHEGTADRSMYSLYFLSCFLKKLHETTANYTIFKWFTWFVWRMDTIRWSTIYWLLLALAKHQHYFVSYCR